jgi:hypothetical protein
MTLGLISEAHQARTTGEKKPVLVYELFFKYGGEGGLTRFARPAGSLFAARSVCPPGCRQLSNPGRGFSSPHGGATCEKKARTYVRALL